MKDVEIAAVRAELDGFVEDLFASLPRVDQRGKGSLYLRGLMLDGKRKSMQPMAERLGLTFSSCNGLSTSPWKVEPVRRAIAFVRRRRSWDDSGADTNEDAARIQARRERSGLPDTARNQTKWSMGLEMIDQLTSWGLNPPPLVGDAGYGTATGFRSGLTERSIPYVLAVTFSTTAHPNTPSRKQPRHGRACPTIGTTGSQHSPTPPRSPSSSGSRKCGGASNTTTGN